MGTMDGRMLGGWWRMAIAFLWLALPLRAEPTWPDVLLVVAEADLSATDEARSAGLERLAREGAGFARWLGESSEAGSQAALLSGRHGFLSGVTHGHGGRRLLGGGAPSLAEILSEAGYRCGMFGAWHVGDHLPSRPTDRGFEVAQVHRGGMPGSLADAWGANWESPWPAENGDELATEGSLPGRLADKALAWLEEGGAEARPAFAWLQVPGGGRSREQAVADFERALEQVLAGLARRGALDDTLLVVISPQGRERMNAGVPQDPLPSERALAGRAWWRWPGKVAAGGEIPWTAHGPDFLPTLAGLLNLALPAADQPWEGADFSGALGEGAAGEEPARRIVSHRGHWPLDESPERHRAAGVAIHASSWRLNGLDWHDLADDPDERLNRFDDHAAAAMDLLADYGRWWERARPAISQPVRLRSGDPRQPEIRLGPADLWPAREANDPDPAARFPDQAALRRWLGELARDPAAVEPWSGRWEVEFAEEGNYEFTLSLLPPEAEDDERRALGRLRAGTVRLRIGRRDVRMELLEGATRVSLRLDLPAGPTDLEAWFEGQLPDGGRLGAVFVDLRRLGPRLRPEIDLRAVPVPAES